MTGQKTVWHLSSYDRAWEQRDTYSPTLDVVLYLKCQPVVKESQGTAEAPHTVVHISEHIGSIQLGKTFFMLVVMRIPLNIFLLIFPQY